MGLSKKENGLIIQYYDFFESPLRWFLRPFGRGAVVGICEKKDGKVDLLEHFYFLNGNLRTSIDYSDGKRVRMIEDNRDHQNQMRDKRDHLPRVSTTLKQKLKFYYEEKEKLIQLHNTEGRFARQEKFTYGEPSINRRPKKKFIPEKFSVKPGIQQPSYYAGGQDSQETLFAPLIEYFEGRPNIERVYNQLAAAIRNETTVQQYLNEANIMTSDKSKFVVSGSFSDIANILQGILEKSENIEVRKDFNALKEAIEILGGTSDAQNTWVVLINNRVKAMPLNSDATELTFGGGVNELANMHFEEYKFGESEVPENKREKVALDRIEGLLSIKDVIENHYSNEHKFHLNASLKGALLYASSLGLNVDQYEL